MLGKNAMDKEYETISFVATASQLNVYFAAIPSPSASNPTHSKKPFYGWAMVDSGASACFIHNKLVKELKLPTVKKTRPRRLKVIDGRDISSGLVDTECTIVISLGSHTETLACNVTDLGSHSIVLGISWLKLHNPSIDWPTKRLSFDSNHCSRYCLDIVGPISGNAKHLEGGPNTGGVEELDLVYPLEGIPVEAGGTEDVMPLESIPAELQDYADVFSEDKVTELPPHRPYDHEIILLEGWKPWNTPVRPIKPEYDEFLRPHLKEMLDKGLIRHAQSFCR